MPYEIGTPEYTKYLQTMTPGEAVDTYIKEAQKQNKNFAILCNDALNNHEIDNSWFIHQLTDDDVDNEPEEISKMNVFIYE